MLKFRLLFGTVMAVLFAGVVIFGGWIDGSLTATPDDDKAVRGTILCIVIALLIIAGQLEFARLAGAKKLKVFSVVSIPASILVATTCYWPQFLKISPQIYLLSVAGFSLLGLLVYQYIRYGTSGVISNCGAGLFSVIYLGVFGGFVVAVRIDFGVWALLMFISVIKSADIGAYAFGSFFGRHKFSPRVSPGKTWEGMAGAVAAAVIVAIVFASSSAIMGWWSGVVFGICLAFIGQLGDLAESMMKRDAEEKDSGKSVPGFGGVLDVVDSPLVGSAFAYLFFMCFCR
jgi:phosphatidate cytidylyltransferase